MDDTMKQTVIGATGQTIESVRQWVMSPEGQTTIANSLKQAHKLASQFRAAEYIDPDKLHKPITL